MRFILLLLAIAGIFVAFTVSRQAPNPKNPAARSEEEGTKAADPAIKARALDKIEEAAFNADTLKNKADKEKTGSAPVEYDASLRQLERLEAEARKAGADDREITFRKYDASKRAHEQWEAERVKEEDAMSDIKARFDKDRAELEAKEATRREVSDQKLLELMSEPAGDPATAPAEKP